MRILHTSDWHLGKKLFKLDRAPEHELFMNWLKEILIKESIDLLLIAGDIFDSPSPPHQSLETFYNFLHKVSLETKTQTLIIAGNHDSGLLLEAPKQILSSHRVKIWGRLSSCPDDHWVSFEGIDICALPFFRSHELLSSGEEDAISALEKYLIKNKERPHILMLHHLAGIFEAAGSEQVITLSGVESIPTELLKSFDYVALGHIHKPQKVAEQCFYSGSPILLRFSETTNKSVRLIEVNGKTLTTSLLKIPVFRDFFTVKTDESNLFQDLEKLTSSSTLCPMVEVQVSLNAPRTGLVEEIKKVLSQKDMELLSFIPLYQGDQERSMKALKNEKIFTLSPLELFNEFYLAKFPEETEVPVDIKDEFLTLLQRAQSETHSS